LTGLRLLADNDGLHDGEPSVVQRNTLVVAGVFLALRDRIPGPFDTHVAVRSKSECNWREVARPKGKDPHVAIRLDLDREFYGSARGHLVDVARDLEADVFRGSGFR